MARHPFSKRSRRRVRTGGKGRPNPTNAAKRKRQRRMVARILATKGVRLIGRRTQWDPRKSTRERPRLSDTAFIIKRYEDRMRKRQLGLSAIKPASPAERQ